MLGRLFEMFGEFRDRADIASHGRWRIVADVQIFQHPLFEWCHRRKLLHRSADQTRPALPNQAGTTLEEAALTNAARGLVQLCLSPRKPKLVRLVVRPRVS